LGRRCRQVGRVSALTMLKHWVSGRFLYAQPPYKVRYALYAPPRVGPSMGEWVVSIWEYNAVIYTVCTLS
jgi:hypothetical protein